MLSIPVAVSSQNFKWQLSLFWHNHRKLYGSSAYDSAKAIIINKDDGTGPIYDSIPWNIDIPHRMCEAYSTYYKCPEHLWHTPLNIQAGLQQILPSIEDDKIIEILDCDMFHLRQFDFTDVRDDEIYADIIYEGWHLKSRSNYKYIIDQLIPNNKAHYYAGGFVPLVGKSKTFKKIIKSWAEYHLKIMTKYKPNDLELWWAGMYSLQAACEYHQVRMIPTELCYIPKINELKTKHYIAHYSIDDRFNKRQFPNIDINSFLDTPYYNAIKDWLINYIV